MKHNERSVVVLRVLGVNVDVANGALENADLGTVAAGFENQSFILYADDLADDTADGSDLIADDQIVAHGVDFLFLFLLRSEHQEIENGKKRDGQELLILMITLISTMVYHLHLLWLKVPIR